SKPTRVKPNWNQLPIDLCLNILPPCRPGRDRQAPQTFARPRPPRNPRDRLSIALARRRGSGYPAPTRVLDGSIQHGYRGFSPLQSGPEIIGLPQCLTVISGAG